MKAEKNEINEILLVYDKIKPEIERKLAAFEKIGKRMNKKEIFDELCFCLLTPQSKAEICWKAAKKVANALPSDKTECRRLEETLRGIRFHRTKAKRITESKETINLLIEKLEQQETAENTRAWIVKNINGLGMKEATHFLRNIGRSEELAILDRHILRKLQKLKIVPEIKSSLTEKKYLEIEKKMRKFSKKIGIPVSHLDFVFWYLETGRIFK
ncbi:MAG: N-glycosylase/DNA lyase [Candidatus Omnitrophica bacterium]|nr:N-glycosylase/DNA lyase [Candidatus Omnitrophota bacterium]